MANNRTFYRGMAYSEWASQQDQDNLEFRAIEAYHKTHPGYDLDEIRNSIYLDIIENEASQKICLETFGNRHPNPRKLNEKIAALMKILFSHSSREYKSTDKKGHGDSIAIRFGGRGKDSELIGFRIESKAIKHAQHLIQKDMVPEVYTVADIVRLGFVKYIEMIPIIYEFRDDVSNRFALDIEGEKEARERLRVDDMLKGFDGSIKALDKDLNEAVRRTDNTEELEEIKDATTTFIKKALSYKGVTKRENARVKDFIMTHNVLYNILKVFERKNLLERGYIDNLCQKGVVTDPLHPFSVESEDSTLASDARYYSLKKD